MEPRKRVRKQAAKSKAVVVPLIPLDAGGDDADALALEVLKECPAHTMEDGRHLLRWVDGTKPGDVLREAVEVVVAENNARLARGGFHPDLIFRTGKESGQFVTLAHNEEGAVVMKSLEDSVISMALQSRFCFISDSKKRPHRPLPGWFVKALTYGDTEYRFPVLNGLLQHPAIHLDGTIVTREGYDPVTKCWVAAGWDSLKVPARPTKAQVAAAVKELREPLEEIIFKGDAIMGASPVKKLGADMTASEANTIGLIITTLLRRELSTAPFFIITSGQWGTGKGLIPTIAAEIAQGTGPLLTDMKVSADQQEKNIDRVLHDHPDAQIVQFDEPQDGATNGRFHSRKLALLATADSYVNRPVYGRKAVRVGTRRTMVFTGISIRPDQDMVRRVSVIELDIPHDGTLPHEREFKHPDRASKVALTRWVHANRRDLIAAVITLVNAWRVAECPQADFQFDFPEWVHTVGGVLGNAGITSWMGNRNDVYSNADEAMKAAFVLALVEEVGSGPITSREIARKLRAMSEYETVKDHLQWNDVWATKLFAVWGDEEAMTFCLGSLLRSMKDRLLSDGNGGRVTVSSYAAAGHTKWTFIKPGHPAPVKSVGGRPRKRVAKRA